MNEPVQINFENTEIAFRHKTDKDLKKARLLFKSFNYKWLLKWGPGLAKIAIALGMKGLIKNTIFAQFCGGENIEECANAIQTLAKSHIGTILDYSVEGEENEEVFNYTCNEIIKTIQTAKGNPDIPFSVFKTTGIIAFDLLQKASENKLSDTDKNNWENSRARFFKICKAAHDMDVRIFVDAEETWIQPAIDALTEEAMAMYNKQKAIVYNTLQMYRHDRLAYLKNDVSSATYFVGYKLVRGAYMEKERKRAQEMGYPSPIQVDKTSCDADFDAAVAYCVEHIAKVSICCGTHNENSCKKLADLMQQYQIAKNDVRIYFSQLLGMSDNISFNMAALGYNVSKYVPYGPVKAVIPYLTRRAIENTSVAGQVGREMRLISTELKRRNS